MLKLVDISKRYGAAFSLQVDTIDVERGKVLVLIGPSGSGKSTLLRLLNGLIVPDSGDILLEGKPVDPSRDLELRRRMGYVIQEGGLFPHLTLRGNLSIQARCVGWTPRRIDERIFELLELSQLPAEILDRYPSEISGGQRQRVSLMRALMLDPPFLLLDEPLGALDPMIRSELQFDLRRIFRELRKTVVMVTHDLFEARFFADHIVLMNEGRIAQEGNFRDFVESPNQPFVTRFVNAQRSLLDTSGGGEP